MFNPLRYLSRWRRLGPRDYNRLVERINQLSRISVRGPGARLSQGPHGTTIHFSGGGGGSSFRIAKVDSDAAGGGYCNCHLQTLDAAYWDSDTADQLDDIGDSVVVLNLAEIGVDKHNLDAGDLIICWTMTDDGGTNRYVGNEVIGRHTAGEW